MADPPTNTKPPISAAKLAACRANAGARRARGPWQGKLVSRFNNLSHGRRAEVLILPGENIKDYQHRLDVWMDELARDRRRTLPGGGLHARAWRKDRSVAAEGSALTKQVLAVVNGFEDRQAEEVQGLVEQLAENPGVIRQLRAMSQGCRYLLGEWQILDGRLRGWLSFEPTQRSHAMHLLGKRTGDLFADPVVVG